MLQSEIDITKKECLNQKVLHTLPTHTVTSKLKTTWNLISSTYQSFFGSVKTE